MLPWTIYWQMITRKTLHWRKPFVTTFYFISFKLCGSFYFLRRVFVMVAQNNAFSISNCRLSGWSINILSSKVKHYRAIHKKCCYCGEVVLLLKWPYIEIQHFSPKKSNYLPIYPSLYCFVELRQTLG